MINATHSKILTSPGSTATRIATSLPEERSPTMMESLGCGVRFRGLLPYFRLLLPSPIIHGFGDRLEPRYIFGAEPLDQ